MNDRKERAKIISELDKNLLVSASAGSGKTTVLVERMVALVEEGKVTLSKMAALTFTKKAAGEFYDRFYKKLQARSQPGFNVEVDDPYSLLGQPKDPSVDKAALSNIDTCFFGTIDAFYQKILNEHPLEAGLSSNAVIIDDDEFNAYLIRRFSDYLKCDDTELREGAATFDRYIGAANFPSFMEGIFNYPELDIYQIPDDINVLKQRYAPLLRDFKEGCKVLVEYESAFRHVKNNVTFEDSNGDSKKAWEHLISSIEQITSLKSDDYKTAVNVFKGLEKLRFNEDVNGLLAKCNFVSNFSVPLMLKGKCCGNEIKSSLYTLLQKIIYIQTIDFLRKVKDDIYNSMIDGGLLTFSMATHCLNNLLNNSKKYKNVIEQIRNGIDCLLIDECQDTDLKQYEIFFRLVANDFKDKFEDLSIDGGKLFICGDRKQGIYHFRGADVSIFDHIKEVFENKQNNGEDFDLVTLTDNYRSNGKLINYFNDIFKDVLSVQGYDPILNDTIDPKHKNMGMYFYNTDATSDPENVANLILQLCEEKGYKFEDFMVITSSKANILDYSSSFSKHSIPFYTEGNTDIHISPLVDAVLSLFKYIGSNQNDKISFLELLSSPLFNFKILDTVDLQKDYLLEIGINKDKKNCPSELLESLASNQNILKALNGRGLEVLIGLIHLIKEEENNGSISNYDDAIKYLNDLQSSQKVIERLSLLANKINAVQIANVHKTKGLQKKIVILTRAGKNNKSPSVVKKDKYYIITHEVETKSGNKFPILNNPLKEVSPLSDYIESEKNYEKEEEKRLLYVAATRAQDYLFVAAQQKDDGTFASSNKWVDLLGTANAYPKFDISNKYSLNKTVVDLINNKVVCNINKSKSFKIVIPSKVNALNKHNELYEDNSQNREDALVFGTMVHKLLENIVLAKDNILSDNVCNYIASNYSRIDLVDKLIEVKNKIYSGGYTQNECPFSDLYNEIKNHNCLTETPFSYTNNDSVISGNIDLIIEYENKVLIIDYKTDANPTDHQAQLNCYISAVKKSGLFAGKTVEAYIYLINK